MLQTAAVVVVALGVFLICEPYAVIDWHSFLSVVMTQTKTARGNVDQPYTLQYLNTPAYWYQIKQLSLVGLGVPLGILAFAGLAFALARGVLRRRRTELLLLIWVVAYFLSNGRLHVKFLRYMLPLVPFLLLMGSDLLVEAYGWAASGSQMRTRLGRLRVAPWARHAVTGIGALVFVSAVLWAAAFVSIYDQANTRVTASQWIYDNVPVGAVLGVEHWDDVLPLNLDFVQRATNYNSLLFPLFDPDSPQKLNWMVDDLRQTDYLIVASNRLYGTIPRLPDRYPMTARYYELLFSGKLGYDLVDFTASYPQLPGLVFVEDTFTDPKLPVPAPIKDYDIGTLVLHLGRVDESFTVYDHPLVMIFKRVRSVPDQDLRALLTGSPLSTAQSTAIRDDAP